MASDFHTVSGKCRIEVCPSVISRPALVLLPNDMGDCCLTYLGQLILTVDSMIVEMAYDLHAKIFTAVFNVCLNVDCLNHKGCQ